MITIKARFDGRVFVPESPVDLPAGSSVEIVFPAPTAPPAPAAPEHSKPPLVVLMELLDELPANPNLPKDFAAQHDHYLYGTPKRP